MSVVDFVPLVYVEHPLLSPREKEVAAWLSTSSRPKPIEIAQQLNISRRTVEKHTQNIYRKLRIRQRAQLVRLVKESRPSPRLTQPVLAKGQVRARRA